MIALVAGVLGVIAARAAGPSRAAAPTTTVPAATTAPASDAVPTTVGAAPADAGTLPEPAREAVDPVRTLVPRIAAVTAVLEEGPDRVDAINQALDDASTTIAVEDGPGTLCAVVPVTAPLMAGGRWERNGEPIASGPGVRRDPPGFGDCLANEDGEPFPDGVYQYVAIGATGARSAAATVVVGVATVDVWLLNNGDTPVCMVQMSPTQADFYEAFSASSPLAPGEAIAIRVADVDHDIRVFGCPPDDALTSDRISPESQTYIALFDEADVATTTRPGATQPATAAAPTTADAPTTTTA